MPDAARFAGVTPVPALPHQEGLVTLVEGQSFCLSGRSGDIDATFAQGLFLGDTRYLSRWELRVDGHRLEPLTVDVSAPDTAGFVGHACPAAGLADAELVVFRDRTVGAGLHEDLEVVNHGLEPLAVVVELSCSVDLADLFAVKEGRARSDGAATRVEASNGLRFVETGPAARRTVLIEADGEADFEPERITWRMTIPPGDRWTASVAVRVLVDGRGLTADSPSRGGAPGRSSTQGRRNAWQGRLPIVRADHAGLDAAVAIAGQDLGALRIFDPEHPGTPIVAAGAPWFMALFGRDSIISAWMTLIADPGLAVGVLQTLARFQGEDVDPRTEEQPGRILHEVRFRGPMGGSFGEGDAYYGSIDATPLFVMLLGELARWGVAHEVVRALLPHADRALAWMDEFGDRDGDGYLEYQRSDDGGLANQGWKDSWDAVRHADGTLAPAPIALCEVQGYAYAAYRARAELAELFDDPDTSVRYEQKAAALRRRFHEDFWVESEGWYALALDADKRRVEVLTSNIGHCLWTGIVDPGRAGAVVARLMSDDLFSGWGVRTLARSARAFNPISYHNGSVWPHDNALCAAGLAAYGYMDEAHRIIEAQLDVAAAFGGRLPELFAGFERGRPASPASYPASCSPQAWASASPLLWLRLLLGLDPVAEWDEIWLRPDLPPWLRRLRVEGVHIAGRRVTVDVEDGDVSVIGAEDLAVIVARRGPPPISRDRSRD